MTAAFRCSAASQDLTEPLAGSASTVRTFLLVEAPGAWGVDAVSGSRLPDLVRARLANLARVHRVWPLMIRGHGRRRTPGTRVFAAFVGGDRPWVETAVLDDVEALVDLDLDGLASGRSPGLTPYDDPLFLVCTHGKHDACCAELGRPLCKAMHAAAPEHTWEVSHIGGDRFAPNVLVLPEGLYYGRLAPENAAGFVAGHRDGELSLPHLRGRCALPFAMQAAEIYLREHLRARAVAALPLVSSDRDRDEVTAVFAVDGVWWRVRVRSAQGEPRRLTCRALSDSGGLEHTLLGIERL
ncbi:MAG: sucrase ferredoxin [Nocardioides sp.]